VGGEAAMLQDYELCAFVTHRETGCTVGLYRNTDLNKIVLAFRGTCAPQVYSTDVERF
jgi:hypothetical protein